MNNKLAILGETAIRGIRKGDTVRLKPNVFLLQVEDRTAQVLFIYRRRAHIEPPLNGHSMLGVESLECVSLRESTAKYSSGPVNHVYISRSGPFGGTVHTTLCGRMALPHRNESKSEEVNCKLCLRKSQKQVN